MPVRNVPARQKTDRVRGDMDLPIVKKLRKELDELYRELNVRIPKDLQEAAAHGDLS